jgi:hypothetical protein
MSSRRYIPGANFKMKIKMGKMAEDKSPTRVDVFA